jgi:GTP-binding protein
MSKPVVALVGRPNVGKSTLFNRLAEERLAVVDEIPGTTRDRLMAEAEWVGKPFTVVDTGGIDPTQAGEGRARQPLSVGSAEFIEQIRSQAEIAIQEADAVLFVTDAESGVTPADQEVANILRRNQRPREGQPWPPVLLVVNKADSESRRTQVYQFYELGMGEPYPISALHGTGTGDLLDALVAVFAQEGEEEEDDSVKIAIAGKPNVGKSSLLNRLLGEERAIVSPIPGTTRDAIDTTLEWRGRELRLVDTAGLRRRGKVASGPLAERYSALRALKAIGRADVCVLVLDGLDGLTAQDAHVAGYVVDEGVGLVLAINKWDLVEKDDKTFEEYVGRMRGQAPFLHFAPVVAISALTGLRAGRVLDEAMGIAEERRRRVSTGRLNRVLADAVGRHQPPAVKGRRPRFYYATQAAIEPPTFVLFASDARSVHFSYQRFLENRIRDAFHFEGTPLRLVFRERTKVELEPRSRSSRGSAPTSKGRSGGRSPAQGRPARSAGAAPRGAKTGRKPGRKG